MYCIPLCVCQSFFSAGLIFRVVTSQWQMFSNFMIFFCVLEPQKRFYKQNISLGRVPPPPFLTCSRLFCVLRSQERFFDK